VRVAKYALQESGDLELLVGGPYRPFGQSHVVSLVGRWPRNLDMGPLGINASPSSRLDKDGAALTNTELIHFSVATCGVMTR